MHTQKGQTKTILIVILAILTVGLVSYLGWVLWQQKQEAKEEVKIEVKPEEKISEITPLDEAWDKYTNYKLGFSINIPKEWKDKYEIREERNTISFVYTRVPELKEPIFTIIVYSKDEWEEVQREIKEAEEKGIAPGYGARGYGGIVFAEKPDETRFVYIVPIEIPYYGVYGEEFANEYSRMVDQVQEIIASFRFR